MSNIYFMCENCGIETNGITFVNGMKFCAKCYHQIFGKDNQQIEITQLKQQLAEKDKEIEEKMMSFEKRCQEYYKSDEFKRDFAIQELEKVKELVKDKSAWQSPFGLLKLQESDVEQIIDKQIKEIKGE